MIGLDVGGFNGDYLWKLKEIGCKTIYCFEPLFYEKCLTVSDDVKREQPDINIKLYDYALYDDGKYNISVNGDSSSIFQSHSSIKEISGKSLSTFCREENLSKFDFIKLNCEGAEYKILNDILQLKIDFEEMFVQFHENVVSDVDGIRRKTIIDLFKKKGYVIHGHQRWVSDDIVWWSISKTDSLRFPSSLPIRELH